MPSSTAAQLARDLARLRTGHGADARRRELRQRLAQVDAGLRAERNRMRLRLAQLRVMARTADTRHPPSGALQHTIDQTAAKLAALDAAIATTMAALEPGPVAMAPAPRQEIPDAAVVAEARAALRGRLWFVAGQLDGLPLPGRLVGQVRAAIFAEIRKLAR